MSDTATVIQPTEKQVNFLRTLLAEREGHEQAEAIRDFLNLLREQNRLSKHTVSVAIKELLDIPKTQGAVSAPSQRRVVTNQYPGKCDECGVRVGEGEGTVYKADSGKWVVNHLDGQCPANDFPFPFGRYALRDDEDVVKFYQATAQGLAVQASDELHRVPAPADKAIIARIAADPEAASRLYGQEIGECGRCGRTLTDEASRAEGIGPVCATKGW